MSSAGASAAKRSKVQQTAVKIIAVADTKIFTLQSKQY